MTTESFEDYEIYNYISKYISFEGVDGSGKSTQAQLTYKKLKEIMPSVILDYRIHPGHSKNKEGFLEYGRQLLFTEGYAAELPIIIKDYLFLLDIQIQTQEVNSLLEASFGFEGFLSISDRGLLSALVYNCRPNEFKTLIKAQFKFVPDVIYIDASEEVTIDRLFNRTDPAEVLKQKSKKWASTPYTERIIRFEEAMTFWEEQWPSSKIIKIKDDGSLNAEDFNSLYVMPAVNKLLGVA